MRCPLPASTVQIPGLVARAMAGDGGAATSLLDVLGERERLSLLRLLLDAGTTGSSLMHVVGSIWANDHQGLVQLAGGQERLRAIFAQAGFGPDEDFPPTIQAWRGIHGCGIEEGQSGYSWTPDRDYARWFALNFAPLEKPLLLSAIIPRYRVVADLGREIVAVGVTGAWIDPI